ncbi:ABC transporter substrate-binding protein [Pseudoduganella flava]|uniref:ABC transporter substrate-binding protein n=2 Tax=Pseudoduganella flava TaxID=871742 RepID=A0ABX6FN99_9BURK|nr:ABC transporter substrate binding protein [Pseudoduganella flava]QGZ37913.1 hypothetical protein GO485_01840 [Pseudoduganella flava]
MGNCAWASVGAGPDTLAVVFPDIGEPYRKVFTEIIDGVEQQARGKVRSVAVGPAQDAAELQTTLRRTGVRTVIALGRQGLKTAGAFDALGVVVGGISALPEQERFRGISLMPDPALLFTWLKTLVPGVKRVIVVYSPQQSAGAVRLARDAARAQGLELVALEAQDLAAAVRRYETAFAGIDGKRDAVWLPQDAVTADDATVLPLVLRESWNRNVALFSSSILHVKKGVLFALYPDNAALGRELAALAQAPDATAKIGLQPLRAVKVAFNTRTAGHIGLTVNMEQHSFDAIFP